LNVWIARSDAELLLGKVRTEFLLRSNAHAAVAT
jgi:hypothetical protein